MMVMDIESDVEGASYVSDKDANFQLMPGWTFPIPGFAEKLVGFKAGEEHEFDMKMPETFPDKEKAGRDVHFKVNIKDVRREKLPELNDEFARKASSGSGGIENLRAAIKADLQKRAQQTEDKAFEEKVIDALVEKSQLQYPPLLVDGEVDRLLQEYINRVRETVQSEDEFKSILKTTSQEKLHEAYRPQAEQRVKRNLVISKLIEAEKVDVGDAEIDFQITALTADSGTKISEQTAYLNKPENRDSLRWWLKTDKAKKLLVEKAKSE
jgi:trigger factor